MEEKVISAPNEELLWEELSRDFKLNPDPQEYHAALEQQERRVILDIFNNHAVGFEAIAFTTFSAYIYERENFRFAIHNQNFTDEIGKFFGMQDILLGFRELDQKFIIKSNNETRTFNLFADKKVRDVLVSLPELSFGIVEYVLEDGDGKAPFLELKIKGAITDPIRLKEIYAAFFSVLKQLE